MLWEGNSWYERTNGRCEEQPKAGGAAEPGFCPRQALRRRALPAVPGFHLIMFTLTGLHYCTRMPCVLLIMGCDHIYHVNGEVVEIYLILADPTKVK